MIDSMLHLKEIRSGYGPIEVLKGFSLEVQRGEIVTLIGANGAGKTSTLMVASRVNPLRGGEVWFKGKNISQFSAHAVVAEGLAQVPEGRKIFGRLRVRENLDLGAYLRNDSAEIKTDRERIFELFPVLKERENQLAGTLSGGEQQMLAIGRALMSKPEMILMDEPSMGVAPLLVEKIFEAVRVLNRDQGLTILLVEQNAQAALTLATRGYVLETGSLTLEGAASQLLVDPRVREAYLGESAL